MTDAPPGFAAVPIDHGGLTRPYFLHAPAPRGTGPIPLVVELHGRGIEPLRFDGWTGFSSLADETGFALALPRAVGEAWNDGRSLASDPGTPDDVGYLLAVIDDVVARLPIDPGRIYVVGMSNGATMAGRLACERAARFAGIAQVAGTLALGLAASCRPAVPLPILSIHGTADRFAPYAGGRAKGPLVRLLVRRHSGPCLGVEAWARFWVTHNRADDVPDVATLGPDTQVRRWHGMNPAADVALFRVDDGGHTWPGGRQWVPPFLGRMSCTFDATRVIWEFLAPHRRS